MTAEQADEFYRELILILRENGLHWIVDEVREAVRLGKTEALPVDLEESDRQRGGRWGRPETGVRHAQRDWTAEERLAILLDAVEAAVCRPVNTESAIVSLLPQLSGRDIAFAPAGFAEELPADLFRARVLRNLATEAGDPLSRPFEPYVVRLDSSVEERQNRANELARALGLVRSELNADLD